MKKCSIQNKNVRVQFDVIMSNDISLLLSKGNLERFDWQELLVMKSRRVPFQRFGGASLLGPTVFASNQLNTPACSFFKQTMCILLKTTRYMTFLRDLEVPDLIF